MTLIEVFSRFPTEDHCIEYLEKIRWPNGNPVCPYCGHECTSNKRADGRYNCGSCHRAFRVTVGTLFHKTHHPLQKWFLLIVLMLNARKGSSGAQLARDIDVPQPTVWLMMMKVRRAMESGQEELLRGVVEIDEFYSGGSSGTPGRGTAKTPVIGAVERNGRARAKKADKANRTTLRSFIGENIHEDALIYSDSYKAYYGLSHRRVNHAKEYVTRDGVHTNNIESFWAIVKRGIFGQFHFISKKYLDFYLAEFCYRFNRRNETCVFGESVERMVMQPNIGKALI